MTQDEFRGQVHAMQAHASTNLERPAPVSGRSEFGPPPSDIRF